MGAIRSELTLAFIFDVTRPEGFDRMIKFLEFAKAHGVPVAGDLTRLAALRRPRGVTHDGTTPPTMLAEGHYASTRYTRGKNPRLPCPRCGRVCYGTRGLKN